MPKILIIEDEQAVCDMLRRLLTRHGYEVFTSRDGREGIRVFADVHPDVTLVDLVMPGLSGMAVITELRSMNPRCSIIVLTAAGSEATETELRNLGIREFIRKGVSLNVVSSAVDKTISTVSHAEDSENEKEAGRESTSVLVVDDEPLITDMVSKFLTRRGYTVLSASNGREALERVVEKRPDVIVLDLYLPDLNGIDVMQELRRNRYPGRIVILTAGQEEDLLQQALQLDAIDIVTKPVDLERLELVVFLGSVLSPEVLSG